MHLARLLLSAAVVLVPLAFAGEILVLKGEPIKGDILAVNDTEVTYDQGGKKITLPLKDVLKIDYREIGKPSKDTYSRVELTDGSIILVTKWSVKKRDLIMTLATGLVVTVPLKTVANVLSKANIDKNRADWKSRVFNTRGREAFVREKDGIINNIECTFGDGDAKGENIAAAVVIDGEVNTLKISQDKLHGMIFKNVLDAKAPPIKCKLFDKEGNLVIVSAIAAREGGLIATTPSGAKFDLSNEMLSRLDFTKGKLDYLSSLEPSKIVGKSNLDESDKTDQWHVYKDTNLNKGPLTLGGVVYASGLAMKPYAELTYDLNGEYREFSALVGIDDNVSADGKTILIIECDGKEREKVEISSTDKKRFKPIVVNIKDVQKLKIIVKSDGEFDVARHLDLADAKVSK